MKNFTTVIFMLLASISKAQHSGSAKQQPTEDRIQFGIKAGYNISNITHISSINGCSRPGFHVGFFASSLSENTISEYAELIFLKQGYNFKTNSTGKVSFACLMLTELANINLNDFFKLQVGLQTAYLMSAKADSNTTPLPSAIKYKKATDYYNRFEFSFTGGTELNPVAGLILGARYTIGLNSISKKLPAASAVPPYIPPSANNNLKNNVLQLYAGYRF